MIAFKKSIGFCAGILCVKSVYLDQSTVAVAFQSDTLSKLKCRQSILFYISHSKILRGF